jgi:uncharacterized protein (DUF433 family)
MATSPDRRDSSALYHGAPINSSELRHPRPCFFGLAECAYRISGRRVDPLEWRLELVAATRGHAVKSETIEIIDRGGPQLSTSRITVQDLVPYFQKGYSHEEILRWIPVLALAEIAVVEHYYCAHQAELDEEDKRIRAYVDEQVRLQRLRIPEEPREQRLARMKDTLRQRKERSGAGNPRG